MGLEKHCTFNAKISITISWTGGSNHVDAKDSACCHDASKESTRGNRHDGKSQEGTLALYRALYRTLKTTKHGTVVKRSSELEWSSSLTRCPPKRLGRDSGANPGSSIRITSVSLFFPVFLCQLGTGQPATPAFFHAC